MEHQLWDILPKLYTYKLMHFQPSGTDHFDCTFKVNLFSENDVSKWLKAFELSSFANFRVSRTAPGKQSRVIFKKYYRCHRNTRANETASKTKKPHNKHTNCEASLLITVNNWNMKQCKDKDLKCYPCSVRYHNFHNHKIFSPESLCHRKPNERIKRKTCNLLLKNHSPSSVLKILKQDLQDEYKDKYSEIINDGSFCPKLQWIYHRYYKIFKCTYPPHNYSLCYSDYESEKSKDDDSDSEICNNIEYPEIISEENILNENTISVASEIKYDLDPIDEFPKVISNINNNHSDNFIKEIENDEITGNYIDQNDYDYLSIGKEETVYTFQ